MSSPDHEAPKPTVIRSVNAPGDLVCVDIFRRADGSFGFEEFKRDPEDSRGWFPIGGFSGRRHTSAEEAEAAAEAAIAWYQTSPNRNASSA